MTFYEKFEKLTGKHPFPWQEALYARFLDDDIPNVCDIPTGLGKTSVMAIWLIALAQGTRMPRRLVYVVNRRTVVDQTTNEAVRLRQKAHTIGIYDLAISTLRGQFADNQEWSSDPSRPAVICGTVDMIGSRLLFNGYRIGFKSRPLHAGFLGQDALLIHDEAHLEPAFQKLIESIEDHQKHERQQLQDDNDLPWPGLKVMALSATGRNGNENQKPAGLTEQEKHPPVMVPDPPLEPIHHVWRRLRAKKKLSPHGIDDEKKLADRMADYVLEHKETGAAVLVFARTIKVVREICKALTNTKNGFPPKNVQLLTGTMRGYERERLITTDPVFARFMPPSDCSSGVTPAEDAVCLVSTSAGEVGVNLSADHMVCDLSTFDSMVQRFGRVNRFGDLTDTRIDVVYPEESGMSENNTKEKMREIDVRHRKTLSLLKQVNSDASPIALEKLDVSDRIAAFAPEPIILPATGILFDAWAMTTIRQKMPGRPPVAPYLHGIGEWEHPRTSVAWRNEAAYITQNLIDYYGDEFSRTLLDDYPLKPQELLNDTSERVYGELKRVASRLGQECTIWLISERGDVETIDLNSLLKAEKKQVIERIADSTILLPPWAGGLTDKGFMDGDAPHDEKGNLKYDVADEWLDEKERKRRQRVLSKHPQAVEGPEGMALIRVIDTDPDADEFADAGSDTETAGDIDEGVSSGKKRFWCWYARPLDAEDATPVSAVPVPWDDHTDHVVTEAKRILEKLKWPEEWVPLKQAVILAAAFHDLGKKRELWQLSIGNPDPTSWYAKPGKPVGGARWRPRHISPYRHELGSILDLSSPEKSNQDQFIALSDEMKDVVLHLIAAHHGFARPHFPEENTIDPDYPQSKADEAVIKAMRRFARLQRRFGCWGLAYLESLLRAADWAASAKPYSCKTRKLEVANDKS